MSSFWPVGKSKFVGVVQPTVIGASAPQRVHRVVIQDQSGSMGWAVDTVAEDIVAHLPQMNLGDVLTVGYFSGVGDFRWIVKGFKLAEQRDYDAAAKIIRQNAHSRNTTCFSEILTDVETVINEIAPLTDTVELVFLTDGHPVVPNYNTERTNIFKAIKAVRTKVSSALIVGYGDYYNRPLLVEMAQALGATLQHADDIKEFGKQLGEIVVKRGRKRTTITLPKGAEAAFSVEDGRVVIYAVDNSTVVAPADVPVYYLAKRNGEPVDVKVDKGQDPYQAAYASALLFLQQGDTEEALSVLSDVGDVYLVNKLSSALTNKEINDVENAINDAATNLTKRLMNGQRKGCAPREDAFDLIDLLSLLQADKQAKFYPYHPAFAYKRIGRKTKTMPGYPKFVADPNVGEPISSLVGNQSELNISIGVLIPGTVDLPDESFGVKREDVGLDKVFNAHIYRTYNIIANALPNVTKLPVSMSESTYNVLVSQGAIASTDWSGWEENHVYALDLLAVPACNRARGKGASDFELLAKRAVESLELGSKLKVLKAKLEELDPDKESARPVTMTDEQQKFLASVGIKYDGTYSPPTEVEDATDVLNIRTFSVKVAKSSPVSMSDFALMKNSKKNINWVGNLMLAGDKEIEQDMPKSNGAAVQWLNKRIAELKDEKRAVDNYINAARYAIALGGHWRKYHKDSEATYSTPATTVTFVFKDDVEKKI